MMMGFTLRRSIYCAAGLLAFWTLGNSQTSHIFQGEISDSQCASKAPTLATSHQEMLKSKSKTGSSNTCAVYCLKHFGAYLVLAAGKNVYRLDRSDLVHGFEGQKVRISGVLDAKLSRIHVLKIELDQKP